MASAPTPGDLRAQIARHQIPKYLLAAEIGLHPARLGGVLTGRYPLDGELAARIVHAIERLAEPRGSVREPHAL